MKRYLVEISDGDTTNPHRTPAMAAGVTAKPRELADTIKVLEDWEAARAVQGRIMKIATLAIAGLTAPAGCETVTEPVSVGPDTY
jgi:hypothetical protein